MGVAATAQWPHLDVAHDGARGVVQELDAHLRNARSPSAFSPAVRKRAGGWGGSNVSAPAHLSDTATGAGASQDAGDLSELDRAVLHGKLCYVLECLRNSTSVVPGCQECSLLLPRVAIPPDPAPPSCPARGVRGVRKRALAPFLGAPSAKAEWGRVLVQRLVWP